MSFKSNKSPGVDDITHSPKIKEIITDISGPLAYIFNLSFT